MVRTVSTGEERAGRTAAELVEDASRHLVSLSPQEVRGELSDGAVLVDVREEDELRVSGWIPDSVWAPRGMLEFWADPADHRHRVEFDHRRRLILYCSSGERSALAASTLWTLGYRDLGHLSGGIEAWKREGLPVEKP
ncbi:MAG TPA: rhodanese-like domain-containing protein [Acidimicrobiia bacterium]